MLVEVNCETDFVARNERFKELVRDVAMHVAAMSPQYLDRESVPGDVLAAQGRVREDRPAGKPPEVVEKILEGKLNKWYEEHTLLEQPFVKDDAIGRRAGERRRRSPRREDRVRRYTKFALGEE